MVALERFAPDISLTTSIRAVLRDRGGRSGQRADAQQRHERLTAHVALLSQVASGLSARSSVFTVAWRSL
jgi:hypothetical protein